jgi:murein DD-endopeptidase MepM/ murein hydrolase activator NlpD
MKEVREPKNMKKKAADFSQLVSPRTHVQKRYFSLMLVPSYSSGKTRSIRIPYRVFYFVLFMFIAILAVIMVLYLQSRFFRQVAEDFSSELGQAQEAYMELQEKSEQEQTQLINDSNSLRSALTEEKLKSHEEQQQQKQSYQETLDSIQKLVEVMERRIQEFEEYRQSIVDQLSAKNYIPPIKTMLDDLKKSQAALLGAQYAIPFYVEERSSARNASASDLYSYFTMLSSKLDAQETLHVNMQELVKQMAPYINNYPTRSPLPGQYAYNYGYRRNPMGGGNTEFHKGVDIGAYTGQPVYSTGGGTVTHAGWFGTYGYLVVIDHGFGIETYYAHNSKVLVSAGQKVVRGQRIALAGSTGRSTGPHVHYEVRVNGVNVNPTKYYLEQ